MIHAQYLVNCWCVTSSMCEVQWVANEREYSAPYNINMHLELQQACTAYCTGSHLIQRNLSVDAHCLLATAEQ
jgi:hypothetical protein